MPKASVLHSEPVNNVVVCHCQQQATQIQHPLRHSQDTNNLCLSDSMVVGFVPGRSNTRPPIVPAPPVSSSYTSPKSTGGTNTSDMPSSSRSANGVQEVWPV
ncbi:hypothetical protein CTI12_AA555070 [Artemisia annua]|uniref:Uncharacterized protein n=1 Tax=Artemisia annua TaxID=35608 RepID=A0A2U1KWY9_ARTAN|nr:hypothetical protein CTI12_AA555070 [Artemisia annua]